MKVIQKRLSMEQIATAEFSDISALSPQLTLVFGSRSALRSLEKEQLQASIPDSIIVGCSTSGEILGTEVTDDTIVITAIRFEKTKVIAHSVTCADNSSSASAGSALAAKFDPQYLKHLLIISEGLTINGSALVTPIIEALPKDVSISGGLSGDGPYFEKTEILFGTTLESHLVCGIGFYGDSIQIGCSSMGGWDPFGPERKITHSIGNVLYELDYEPALELYKRYLGDLAHELPASGLLFPLTIKPTPDSTPIVRTLLAVDETKNSLTFAGDMPIGSTARLMKANFDRLIDGATNAALELKGPTHTAAPELALLISCVGRKLILKQRIEEEIEGVREIFGPETHISGFYSYGEISPTGTQQKCELHNQTMTITTFSEV